MPAFEGLLALVSGVLGKPATDWLQLHVEIPARLEDFLWSEEAIHRAWVAQALNLCLFHKLVENVPDGRLYVEEQAEQGRKVVFDHGAIRTVDWAWNGELPRGRQAFSRVLEPLGFTDVRTYPLTKLGMTGWAYRHQDLPASIAQFFVSELHPGRFSEAFQDAVTKVVASSRDPLQDDHLSILDDLQLTKHCSLAEARFLLPALYHTFERQHGVVEKCDYRLLLSESAEMAWIATEGNAFNHLTDRVADLAAVVQTQRDKGRAMKDNVEVSSSGRVMQTAYKACTVQRGFIDAEGKYIELAVPGSFVEFIQRLPEPDSGQLDLHFDSANAQGIFKMTDSRA